MGVSRLEVVAPGRLDTSPHSKGGYRGGLPPLPKQKKKSQSAPKFFFHHSMYILHMSPTKFQKSLINFMYILHMTPKILKTLYFYKFSELHVYFTYANSMIFLILLAPQQKFSRLTSAQLTTDLVSPLLSWESGEDG